MYDSMSILQNLRIIAQQKAKEILNEMGVGLLDKTYKEKWDILQSNIYHGMRLISEQ